MNIQTYHSKYKQSKSRFKILLLILFTCSITVLSFAEVSSLNNVERPIISTTDYIVPGAIDLFHDEEYLYVLETNTIGIYQMNNPYPPTLLAISNKSSSNFLQFRVNQSTAYIMNDNLEVLIYNLSDFNNISQIASVDFSPFQIRQFDVYNGSLLAIADLYGDGAFVNIDISNLTDIHLQYLYLPEYHNFVDFDIHGQYLYLLDREFFIRILDLTNTTQPDIIQNSFRQSQYNKIQVYDDFIYILENSNTFTIVNKNNNLVSTVASSKELEILNVKDMIFKQSYAYFIDFDTIEIIKTTIPSVPTSYGKQMIQSYSSGFNTLDLINNYLYIGRNYFDQNNNIVAVDITNPTDLKVLWPTYIEETNGNNQSLIETIISICILAGIIFVVILATILTVYLVNKTALEELKEEDEKVEE